jgi:hypothetical protein
VHVLHFTWTGVSSANRPNDNTLTRKIRIWWHSIIEFMVDSRANSYSANSACDCKAFHQFEPLNNVALFPKMCFKIYINGTLKWMYQTFLIKFHGVVNMHSHRYSVARVQSMHVQSTHKTIDLPEVSNFRHAWEIHVYNNSIIYIGLPSILKVQEYITFLYIRGTL